jgi:hypothetical protein
MPSGKQWMNFVYINLGYFAQIALMYYWSLAAEIKKDWNTYRCNPMYMPLSDNMQEDFTYCVQNTQTDLMGHLLQPITFVTSSLTDLGGSIGDSINGAREMTSGIRSFVGKIVESIFGVFLNLVLEFQKMSISIKDLVGKIIGILVTVMYIMDGSNKTIVSMWAGPTGQLVRALGGCFSPETVVELRNGKRVLMKNLELGDVLKNGSIVHTVMKINNTHDEPFYKFNKSNDDEHDVYVTGTHMIQYKDKFIKVKNHPDAILQTTPNAKWFSCLITSDHKIALEKYVFWDWEDDILTGLPHL